MRSIRPSILSVIAGAAVALASPALADYSGGAAAFQARNFSQAYLLLLPAAHAGDPRAQFMLGQMSDSGLGPVQRDATEATRWYLAAARLGHGPAQYAIARAYAEGHGVPVDAAQSIAWLNAAAGSNFVPAILALADMYDRGAGVPRNVETATNWMRRAASLGSPRGLYILAERTLAGVGTPANAADGWMLMRQAAERGEAAAMLRLGQITGGSGSTAEQRISALTMLLLAIRFGGDDVKREATRLRGELTAHMLPNEIADATTRSRAFQPPPGAVEIDGPRMQASPAPSGRGQQARGGPRR